MQYLRRVSRRLGKLLGIAAMLILGSRPLAAAGPENGEAALYQAAATAIAKGQTEKTRMLGFSIIKTSFTELPTEGAVLVGFDLGIGKFLDIDNIYAIRAVYRTANGEASYGEHGLFKDK